MDPDEIRIRELDQKYCERSWIRIPESRFKIFYYFPVMRTLGSHRDYPVRLSLYRREKVLKRYIRY
jgi:hypothetical protein